MLLNDDCMSGYLSAGNKVVSPISLSFLISGGKDVSPFQKSPIIALHQADETSEETAETIKTGWRTVRWDKGMWSGKCRTQSPV